MTRGRAKIALVSTASTTDNRRVALVRLLSGETVTLTPAQYDLWRDAKEAGKKGVIRNDRARKTIEKLERYGLVEGTLDVRICCGKSQLVWTVIASNNGTEIRYTAT